jgi:hypothetical protein
MYHAAMVTRKPVPQPGNAPPYPTTPTTSQPPNFPPSAAPIPVPASSSAQTASTSSTLPPKPIESHQSDEEDDDEWNSSDSDWEMEGDDKGKRPEIPVPLQASSPNSRGPGNDAGIPAALRVGPPGGVPQKSTESLRTPEPAIPWSPETRITPPVKMQSYNPFLRPQNTGQALFGGGESSAAVWGGASPISTQGTGGSNPIAELPAGQIPIDTMSKMSLSELPATSSPISAYSPLFPQQPYPEKEAVVAGRQDSIASTAWDPQMDVSSLDAFSSRAHGLRNNSLPTSQRTWQEQQEWDRSQRERKQMEAAAALERATKAEQERLAEEEWHRGEAAIAAADAPPRLPPRVATGDQPAQKSVNAPSDPTSDVRSGRESPNTTLKKQRNQTYQIKKVRWFDASSQKFRVSPVLVQNANGPCPLLALVNALTLSTPVDMETVLVETLRTREQVSLGLLVDAVFEELMSGRRGDAAQDLPDVGDLYSFLITLHTGMNVNPRFVFTPDRRSMELHPAFRPTVLPGGFEETREMKLYSTFNVPLMHGWLPTKESPAYAAFDRSAKTYEDAQNVQFYEEELEAKISTTGLTSEEQAIFEDLHVIKSFLSTWPTQLTEHGLGVLLEHIKPGEFAILFRNDHFSTIYKEPRSKQILILVTDAGYSSHDEIVWESLVDISGRGTEHYSGDFRPVSHNISPAAGPAGPRGSSLSQRPVQSMLDVDQGWTSVQGKNKKRENHTSSSSFGGQESGVLGTSSVAVEDPLSPTSDVSKTEQEDHDLALALQLQEEEEVRHRREQDARRREEELSNQVLDQQQRTPAPAQANRPLIPPRRARPTNSASEDAPPPTYEQASKDRRFVPPRDHPASPHAPVGGREQQSAYMQTAASSPGGPSALPRPARRNSRSDGLVNQVPPGNTMGGPGMGPRRRQSTGTPAFGPGKDEKCIIM